MTDCPSCYAGEYDADTGKCAACGFDYFADLERCAYCGARAETPCDEPPTDTCETALAATFDTTPACVRAVLGRPGKYRFDQTEFYWFFEVDDERRVWQLNPESLARDGLLSRHGWSPVAALGKVRPV